MIQQHTVPLILTRKIENQNIQLLEPVSLGKRKTGYEQFHVDGVPLPAKLLSFWQWSSSELIGNSLRGILAEYIVASDLGCISETEIRAVWDAYDLKTTDGFKVEVKSGAYLQSWTEDKLSAIKFGIKPTNGWDAENNKRHGGKFRQSDVYVFCLLQHTDKNTIDPMDLAQWEFYILPTYVLNREVNEQASISLNRLKNLHPIAAKYGEISDAIRLAMTR